MMIKTNKRFRHLVFFRLKKKDNNRKKKEAEKRTDEEEATKLHKIMINKKTLKQRKEKTKKTCDSFTCRFE